MKRELFLWQFGGFTFAVALGSLLHFVYDWTGSVIVAPISAINESTWEHIKILFFPMLIYATVQYFFFKKDYKNFWTVKAIGILVGLELIPVLFYTYTGCFGTPPDWLNIVFFFLSAGSSYAYEYHLFKALSQPTTDNISPEMRCNTSLKPLDKTKVLPSGFALSSPAFESNSKSVINCDKALFKKGIKPFNIISIIIIVVLALAFIAFTFNPPKLPLFLDPITKTYGLT